MFKSKIDYAFHSHPFPFFFTRKSKAVTDKYLLWVLKQEFFSVSREKCSVARSLKKRATVQDLMEILSTLTETPLGFDVLNPPKSGLYR